MRIAGRLTKLAVLFTLVVILMGCEHIDDDRIPRVNVNIVFANEGVWAKYGVAGALDSRRFIRNTSPAVPVDFPYTANTFTGYGGVLLVGDLYGNPVAYDLACPYEAKPDIRINVDKEANNAVCPVCGSTYDIFGGQGRPTSGPAASRGYGLTRYYVLEGSTLNYRVITR